MKMTQEGTASPKSPFTLKPLIEIRVTAQT